MRADQRIRRLSAGHGLQWMTQGAGLLSIGWRPLSGVAALWLMISLIVVVPLIGQLLLALITPLLTAGVLVAYDGVARGQSPTPQWLLRGWQHPRARSVLINLGLWGILGSLIAVGFVAAWMGQQLSEAEMQALLAAPEQAISTLRSLQAGPSLWLAILVFAAVLASLVFAIPLAIFGEERLLTALYASLKAVLVNVLPVMVYLIALVAVFSATAVVTSAVVALLASVGGVLGAIVAQVLVLMLGMAVQMLMAAGQYVAFCQIFGWTAVAPDQEDGSITP